MIKKELKFGSFTYDDDKREFGITIFKQYPGAFPDEMPEKVTLNKVYAFAFVRFFIRISQRIGLEK